MRHGALAVLRVPLREFPDDAAKVYAEFTQRYCSPAPMSGVFFQNVPAGHKSFVRLYNKAHDQPIATATADAVHSRVEEAQLFLEAIHSFMGHVAEASGMKVEVL